MHAERKDKKLQRRNAKRYALTFKKIVRLFLFQSVQRHHPVCTAQAGSLRKHFRFVRGENS